MKAVILFTKGKAWKEGKPHWEQDLEPHREHLIDRLRDRLITAGQYTDHTGGIVLTYIDSLDEAEEIAKTDPAVIDGILDYEVHPWEPLLGEKFER